MTLLSLIVVLLLEQVRPVRPSHAVELWVDQRLRQVMSSEAPTLRSAWVSWVLIVGGTALASMLLVRLLGALHPVLEFAATAGLLYLTMGFRRFSHWFNEIQAALRADDLLGARALLRRWVDEARADHVARAAAEQGDASSVARESIRLALVAAQRHVFGVIFWFVLLPGPAGALGYWLSGRLLQVWVREESVPSEGVEGEEPFDEQALAMPNAFARVASTAYRWVDYLPVRVTAVIFAVVGNFEDSISMWRARAAAAPGSVDDTDRILLASGAGAMGYRLSIPDAPAGFSGLDDESSYEPVITEPELREADVNTLDTAVGLVWRAIVMWFFMVLLFYFGRWLG